EREAMIDYYVDKLVADAQARGDEIEDVPEGIELPRLRTRGDILPAHVRDRYLALVQDDGSNRCSEVVEKWIADRRPSSKTEAEFRAAWTRMVALALDGRDAPVKAVNKANIRQMKDRLLVAKGRRGEAALSPVTVSKVLNAVKRSCSGRLT